MPLWGLQDLSRSTLTATAIYGRGITTRFPMISRLNFKGWILCTGIHVGLPLALLHVIPERLSFEAHEAAFERVDLIMSKFPQVAGCQGRLFAFVVENHDFPVVRNLFGEFGKIR